jgi:hypothetical protein
MSIAKSIAEASSAVIVVFLAACDGGPTGPVPDLEQIDLGNPPRNQNSDEPVQPDSAARLASGRILVDASHDGGVWWFPQAERFYPDSAHQGKELADYLRSLGYDVTEVPRGWEVTDNLLSSFTAVIRAGEWGAYGDSELEAYQDFVSRETTLVLLSDHRRTDQQDELAEMLGVHFSGVVEGSITQLAEHALMEGVEDLPWGVGAYVDSWDPDHVEMLGWLDGGQPVMGLIESYPAKILFIGDTNGLEWLPQPFLDNLIKWGFEDRTASSSP